MRGSLSHSESGRLVPQAVNRFAMAAAIGTHGTVGVAGQCQHSLPFTALVEGSSRSPLERHKREMLYTLMTFPQRLSETTAPLKLVCPGWREWRRVPTAQQRKGNTESTVCAPYKACQQGERVGHNRIFMWHGACRGQPQYCLLFDCFSWSRWETPPHTQKPGSVRLFPPKPNSQRTSSLK